MYFVNIKRPGYILFSATPSECAAVALTEQQDVHFLLRDAIGSDWRVAARWKVSETSHTDFMLSLHHVAEPTNPAQLLDRVPAHAERLP